MLIRTSKAWLQLMKIIDNVPRMVREQRSEFSRRIAHQYYNNVLSHLAAQDLDWEALQPYYLEAKRQAGLDTRIWIASGLLRASIEIIPITDDDKETTYFIGISGDATYPDGTNVALVAIVLEYGRLDRTIPARPLFRPSFRETRQQLRDMARLVNEEVYDKYIRRYLRT